MDRPAPMQTVELVEDDGHDGDATSAPARHRSRAERWRLVRRWAPVPVTLVLVLVGVQAVEVARDRAALAALGEVPGVVPPVDPDVRVLWTPPEPLTSLFWGLREDGVLIGQERPADGSQALVAVDELTGERLWSTPLAPARPSDVAGSPIGGCTGVPHVSGRVACLVSDGLVTYGAMSAEMVPGELSTVVVVDTTDGSVVAEQPVPGAVAFTVLPDSVVVAVQDADDAVTLVATGLLDGEPRWRTTLPAPTREPRGDVFLDGSIALFRTLDGPGAVVSPGRMVLLDDDGEVLRADIEADAGWQVDEATRAVSAFSREPGGTQRTTFLGRERDDVTVPGMPVTLSADDGSLPGLVLMSDSSLHMYDRDSPTPLWSIDGLVVDSALVLRGHVYASSGRGLVAIDAHTGDELWRTPGPEGRTMGGLVTDGRHLLSAQQRPDLSGGVGTEGLGGAGELAAYRLDDGREDWRVDLPDGLKGIWSTGSTLLGWGDAGTSVLG